VRARHHDGKAVGLHDRKGTSAGRARGRRRLRASACAGSGRRERAGERSGRESFSDSSQRRPTPCDPARRFVTHGFVARCLSQGRSARRACAAASASPQPLLLRWLQKNCGQTTDNTHHRLP
jgi:hypothetical protein